MKHLYRKGLLFLGLLAAFTLSYGQVSIPDTNPVTIDFSGFAGGGFATAPTADQLDADDWATTGLSDGSKDFSVENVGGDHARGTSPSTTGGIYGVDTGSGNNALVIRYGGSDFTPGTLTLRLQNNTGTEITNLDIAYDVVLNNDQARSTSLNFSYSEDNATYTAVPTLDFTSPEAADANGYVTENKSFPISGLSVADGEFIYLQWTGDDVGGSGSRDLLGIDNISVQSIAPASNTIVEFASASATISEAAGTFDLTLGITNEDATNPTDAEVQLTTGSADDVNSYATTIASFPAGSVAEQTITLTITDDAAFEGPETLVFTITETSGGNAAAIGFQDTFELTIEDNDPLPAETLPYLETFDDFAAVTTFSVSGANEVWESVDGVASMNGFNTGDIEEDWLILPAFNLDASSDENLSFDAEYNFGSEDANNFLKLVYSTDYSGVGDPSTATWTELPYTAPSASGTIANTGRIDVSGIVGTSVYFALQYRYEPGSYRGWEIDNILLEENPILPEPTNHVASFSNDPAGFASVNLTWDDNAGTQAPDGFLVKYSSVSPGDIAAPVDGVAEADGAGVLNVPAGIGSTLISDLMAETQYFFNIYSYTNAGADINYKTDGTVPSLAVTTSAVPVIFISEVADPSDDAGSRFVELYNPGDSPVDLAGFFLSRQSNGGFISDIELAGTIPAAGTFVIANNSPDFLEDYGVGEADQYTTSISSNGDDGYFLFVGGGNEVGILYDSYGVLDVDGTDQDWEFLDSRAVRNVNIVNPNATWTASEWTIDFPTSVSTLAGRFDPTTHFACVAPETAPAAIQFANVTESALDLSWTAGDGDAALVLVKEGAAVDADIISGTAYTADAAFAAGQELGTGNFVVFAGAGSSVSVTGLSSGTEYFFSIYEYSSADNCYNLASLTGSQFTVTPNDTNSDIVAPTAQAPEAVVGAASNASESAFPVFNFTITDEGTDGISTLIDAIVIEAGAANTAAWGTALGGATLEVGQLSFDMTIEDDSITLDLSGNELEILNGTSADASLSVWFSTTVNDGEVLQFEIPVNHDFSSLSSNSLLLNPIVTAVTGNIQTIDVEATAFELDFSPVVGIAEDFSLAVTAVDANGNVDEAARTISLSATSGLGALTSTVGLTGQAMTGGVYLWADLQLDAADNYVLTVDDDGSALTATADIEALALVDAPAQILITEVVVTPTDGEYVEIYNNSQDIIALGNYYLTDATFAGGDTYYYNIVTGTNAGGGGFGDWFARFPAGSVIQPGEVQTVSLTGSDAFLTTYGALPTYELFEDGAEADEIPDMLEALPGSVAGQGGLTNGGEIVMLFYWDGLSDLVTDIDYVMWGDQNEAIDKTGISIDGPDADTDASTYLDDLATANQALISAAAHADGSSWQRLDFDEGIEVATGGNGVDGNNEMTENLGETFFENIANPGEIIEPGSALITLDTELFNGSFGFVPFGESSEVTSYTVTASGLLNDLVITPPVGFEIAGEMDFSGTIYTNSTPWTITPVDEAVSQTIYVRFTPLAAAESYGGDISNTSVGAISSFVAVSGIEGVFDTAPSLSGVVLNEVLPDPNFSGTNGYDTDGSGASNTEDEFIEIHNTSESPVDISGWQLIDESGVFFEFPAATTLGAGNYAAVLNSVQEGGTLPTPSAGNLAFEAGGGSLSNGGENFGLYDPVANEYVQAKYGAGQEDAVLTTGVGASLVGIIEDWGADSDGSSLVREVPGSIVIVVHENIQGADAASFAEPTIDPNAPQITAEIASFSTAFGNVVVGEESAISTYSVSAINLNEDLVITASTGFQLSSDGTTFESLVTLSPTNQEVTATTITVKYVPTGAGSDDGVISHTSAGASTVELEVSGAGITDETIFFEGFGSCDALNAFTAQSVSGDNVWECSDNGNPGGAAAMSGFSFSSFTGVINEDWLVSPAIDLSSVGAAQLSFDTDVAFDGTGTLSVQVSSDYSGDVTTANWTELDATFDVYTMETENDGVFVNSGDIDLTGGAMIYLAFKYVSEDDAEGAVEYRVDNILVTERQPEWVVNTSGFVGDYGTQEVGTQSVGVAVSVEGFALVADATVNAPAEFELALSSDFANASTSLTLSPVEGVISEDVYIRFAPTTAGAASGDVVFSTAGFDDVTLAVSGTGTEPALGFEDDLSINVYPNPVQNVFTLSNETGKQVSVKLFSLDGSQMNIVRQGDQYNIGSLNAGVYILVVRDADENELARRQIIKN